jgi:hypothetical protein
VQVQWSLGNLFGTNRRTHSRHSDPFRLQALNSRCRLYHGKHDVATDILPRLCQ